MIRIKKKGECNAIELCNSKNLIIGRKFQITLKWSAVVDLSLHAFGITNTWQFNHIYSNNKGHANHSPFITLDRNAGVGNTKGDNKKNLVIYKLEEYSKIVFAANIFRLLGFMSKGDNFEKHEKSVIANSLGQTFEDMLSSNEVGKWAITASIDNSNDPAFIVNNNQVVTSEPNEYLIQNLDSNTNILSNTNNLIENIDRQKFLKQISSGTLTFFLSGIGVHKFYLGFLWPGLMMLGLTFMILLSTFLINRVVGVGKINYLFI